MRTASAYFCARKAALPDSRSLVIWAERLGCTAFGGGAMAFCASELGAVRALWSAFSVESSLVSVASLVVAMADLVSVE